MIKIYIFTKNFFLSKNPKVIVTKTAIKISDIRSGQKLVYALFLQTIVINGLLIESKN